MCVLYRKPGLNYFRRLICNIVVHERGPTVLRRVLCFNTILYAFLFCVCSRVWIISMCAFFLLHDRRFAHHAHLFIFILFFTLAVLLSLFFFFMNTSLLLLFLFFVAILVFLLLFLLKSYVMGRHRSSYEHPGDDDINEIIGNGSLSEHYLALARDLDVMEAKVCG